MRVHIPKHSSPKVVHRIKKKLRIRKKITGTAERPRLCLFKSAKHFYAQVIDDVAGKTLLSVSTLKQDKNANKDVAQALGKEIAEQALKSKIENVVFDRNGYLYHGRVKAFADSAREAGLKF